MELLSQRLPDLVHRERNLLDVLLKQFVSVSGLMLQDFDVPVGNSLSRIRDLNEFEIPAEFSYPDRSAYETLQLRFRINIEKK